MRILRVPVPSCFFVILFLMLWPKYNCDLGALIVRSQDSISEGESENTDDEISTSFVATDRWQEIKPGQQIPAGLHIRLNLQTGKKEAKLLDKNEINKRESLKKISDDVLDPELIQRAENEFKSIDQIKKEFADLKLNVKTDYEILVDLISSLREQNVTDENKLLIFADLEYIVHQYDNSQDFVKLGGLDLIIPVLNSSNDDVRASAAVLLGSALQSNPKVQIAALESALLMKLVRIIIWDSSIAVQKNSMFALSCLVRQFPLAQQHFIDQGGFAALAEMFLHKRHINDFDKLLLKSVTLVSDLMEEQNSAMVNSVDGDKIMEEKLRQYKQVKLSQAINVQGWCSLIPMQLNSPDHDDREKILRCMLTLVINCETEFKNYQPQLSRLETEYRTLAETETDETDHYYADLHLLTYKLLSHLMNFAAKDEL